MAFSNSCSVRKPLRTRERERSGLQDRTTRVRAQARDQTSSAKHSPAIAPGARAWAGVPTGRPRGFAPGPLGSPPIGQPGSSRPQAAGSRDDDPDRTRGPSCRLRHPDAVDESLRRFADGDDVLVPGGATVELELRRGGLRGDPFAFRVDRRPDHLRVRSRRSLLSRSVRRLELEFPFRTCSRRSKRSSSPLRCRVSTPRSSSSSTTLAQPSEVGRPTGFAISSDVRRLRGRAGRLNLRAGRPPRAVRRREDLGIASAPFRAIPSRSDNTT